MKNLITKLISASLSALVIVALAQHNALGGTPLLLTFLSGDITAPPTTMSGSNTDRSISLSAGLFVASVDYAGWAANPNCTGDVGLLTLLQGNDQLSNFKLSVPKSGGGTGISYIQWVSYVNGRRYGVIMSNFKDVNMVEEATQTSVQLGNGLVFVKSGSKTVLSCNAADSAFTVSK